jgi:hypothetical protein
MGRGGSRFSVRDKGSTTTTHLDLLQQLAAASLGLVSRGDHHRESLLAIFHLCLASQSLFLSSGFQHLFEPIEKPKKKYHELAVQCALCNGSVNPHLFSISNNLVAIFECFSALSS